MESIMSNILALNKKKFFLAGTLSLIIIFFFARDFSPDTKIAPTTETNTPSKKPEHQNSQTESLIEVSESIKHTANLKNENAKINNSVSLASSNTEVSKDSPTPKTFEELAETYNTSFKKRAPRPTLAVFDEQAKERLNKIIANGAGCNHEINQQECEQIFNNLKTHADLGNIKAIHQYGMSRFNESAGALYDSNNNENELRSKYNEGKDYLLKIGSKISSSDALVVSSIGRRFDTQEESLAWILIAKKLGDDAPLSFDCKLNRLQCTPELFLKAKDIADAYVDLYQIDK